MRRLLYIVLFLLTQNVYAEGIDYAVQDIKINELDKNITKARNEGVAKAHRKAFAELLLRMKVNKYFVNEMSDDDISKMTKSRQIKNEQMSSNGYVANIDIVFDKEFVEYTLKEKNINEYSQKDIKYIVFPIFKKDRNLLLWEEENQWMDVWKSGWKNSKNIVIPDGDIDDIENITLDVVKQGKYDDFQHVLTKYNGDVVVFVYLGKDVESGDIITIVDFSTSFERKKLKMKIKNHYNLKDEKLMKSVKNKIIEYIKQDNNLFQEKKVKAPIKKDVDINVSIKDLQHWLQIKRKIDQLNLGDIQVKSLSKDRAVIRFASEMDIDEMGVLFKISDLKLDKDNGKYYLYLK